MFLVHPLLSIPPSGSHWHPVLWGAICGPFWIFPAQWFFWGKFLQFFSLARFLNFFFHRLLSYVSVGSQQYRGAIKFFYWFIAWINIVIDDCSLNYIEKLDCKIKIINVFNFSIKETRTHSHSFLSSFRVSSVLAWVSFWQPQWTSTHQRTIHWMLVITQLWMNLNWVNIWFHLAN